MVWKSLLGTRPLLLPAPATAPAPCPFRTRNAWGTAHGYRTSSRRIKNGGQRHVATNSAWRRWRIVEIAKRPAVTSTVGALRRGVARIEHDPNLDAPVPPFRGASLARARNWPQIWGVKINNILKSLMAEKSAMSRERQAGTVKPRHSRSPPGRRQAVRHRYPAQSPRRPPNAFD